MTKLTLSESFDLVPSPLFWAAAANVQWGEKKIKSILNIRIFYDIYVAGMS